MKTLIIAIDGYSGTGKSSTAKKVAEILNFLYIDSGAMYRAVTLHFLKNKVSPDDIEKIKEDLGKLEISFQKSRKKSLPEIHIGEENVEDEIRTQEVSENVSNYAKIPEVRQKLVAQQQHYASSVGVVMDGRDIGTVVFPDADLKVFMTADINERAKRRLLELKDKGIDVELNDIISNLKERDYKDSERAESPLVKAEGAIEIDTTNLTFDDQVHKIVRLAEELRR